METSTFRNLLRRTLILPLVLLALLAVTLVVEVLSLTSSLRRVDHTHQVIDKSRQAMRYMLEMESSVRAYDLTGDKSFVKEYETAKAELPASIDQLVQLTSDNQLEQSRLKDIRQLDDGWVHWAEQEIAHREQNPPAESELALGTRLMDEIWRRQKDVVGEEERLLNERSRRASRLGRIVVITAVGLSAAVLVLLLTLTRRELRSLARSYEEHLAAEAERTRQLQESRESFRITLNSLAEGVVATDAQGKITFINPAAEELTGWKDVDEACGRPLEEVVRIIDESTRVLLQKPLEELPRRERFVPIPTQLSMLDRHGNEFPVEVNIAPIMSEQHELVGTTVVFRDITQRRQTEQTLRVSERLSQAGRLSATIAHEIRNPLDTVTNLVYLLQHDTNSAAVTQQYLEMASEELARITQITGQLLTFHREARHPVFVSISEVLDSVLTLYAPQIRRAGIAVERRFEITRKVRGFPGELRQVFSNLVGNAIDAMPNGGRLILKAREGFLWGDSSRKGVRTTIVDTGSGMPLGVRRNLFAPFYTTKGEKGTGLGLWVSRGIIERHEGTIHVNSSIREGRCGTAFSVFLPFEQIQRKLDVVPVLPLRHT
jgi:PAS domain S-box-containing protein